MRYLCKHCGNTITINGGELYDFCPVCGSRGTLEERRKGRDTALEIADRVRELLPDLDRTRAEYLKYYNEYQKLSQRLFDSCRRGNISRDEIPIYRPEKSYRTKATLKSKAKKKS